MDRRGGRSSSPGLPVDRRWIVTVEGLVKSFHQGWEARDRRVRWHGDRTLEADQGTPAVAGLAGIRAALVIAMFSVHFQSSFLILELRK